MKPKPKKTAAKKKVKVDWPAPRDVKDAETVCVWMRHGVAGKPTRWKKMGSAKSL
jgi:hypothetical protein